MSDLSRRQLIRYGGGFLGTSLAATVLGSQLSHANAKDRAALASNSLVAQKKDFTPDQALAALMAEVPL